jgi:phosphonate transport system substrate-binding protein
MNVYRWLAPRLALIVAVPFVITACGLNQLAERPLGSADRPIRMATVPFLETQRLTKGMKDIGDYIEKETGLKVQGDVPTSYVAVVEAICANKLDVAWVSPLAYILARQKCGADMQLASLNSQGKTTYHGLIIARTASDIQKIEDIKGKRFAWVDATSTSGYLYPRALLADKGVPESALGQQVFAGGHDKVVIALMNGQADAGAIYDDARTVEGVVKQFPNVKEATRVVGQTEEIPNDGVAFRKDMPADVTKKVKDALLKLSSTDEGKKVFRDSLGTTGVFPTTDAEYNPVRKAAQVLNLNLEEELKKLAK